MRAKYKVLAKEDCFILIEDLADFYGTMTVTNDAENVIKDLVTNYQLTDDQVVYYIDTEGRVDILLHKGSEFTGFDFGYDTLTSFNANRPC